MRVICESRKTVQVYGAKIYFASPSWEFLEIHYARKLKLMKVSDIWMGDCSWEISAGIEDLETP